MPDADYGGGNYNSGYGSGGRRSTGRSVADALSDFGSSAVESFARDYAGGSGGGGSSGGGSSGGGGSSVGGALRDFGRSVMDSYDNANTFGGRDNATQNGLGAHSLGGFTAGGSSPTRTAGPDGNGHVVIPGKYGFDSEFDSPSVQKQRQEKFERAMETLREKGRHLDRVLDWRKSTPRSVASPADPRELGEYIRNNGNRSFTGVKMAGGMGVAPFEYSNPMTFTPGPTFPKDQSRLPSYEKDQSRIPNQYGDQSRLAQYEGPMGPNYRPIEPEGGPSDVLDALTTLNPMRSQGTAMPDPYHSRGGDEDIARAVQAALGSNPMTSQGTASPPRSAPDPAADPDYEARVALEGLLGNNPMNTQGVSWPKSGYNDAFASTGSSGTDRTIADYLGENNPHLNDGGLLGSTPMSTQGTAWPKRGFENGFNATGSPRVNNTIRRYMEIADRAGSAPVEEITPEPDMPSGGGGLLERVMDGVEGGANKVGGKLEGLLGGVFGPLQQRKHDMYGGWQDRQNPNRGGDPAYNPALHNWLTQDQNAIVAAMPAAERKQMNELLASGKSFNEALRIVREGKSGKKPEESSTTPFPKAWYETVKWPNYVKLPWAPTPSGVMPGLPT